jgi:phage shock protein E
MKFKTIKSAIIFSMLIFFSNLSYAETIWVDVRSVAENRMDNIEGDINIPHTEIVEKVELMYPDKATEINLYCRSGGRAGKALGALQEAGYKNVKNVGGIFDARKERVVTN